MIACDGREAVDKPIKKNGNGKGQWNTKNILQLCRCSHVFLRNSQWQSFGISLFWRTLKQDAQSLKLWSLLQVPDLLIFLQHQPLMMWKKTLLKREMSRLMTRNRLRNTKESKSYPCQPVFSHSIKTKKTIWTCKIWAKHSVTSSDIDTQHK